VNDSAPVSDPILARIRTSLRDAADPATRDGARRFFREDVATYGVKTPAVRTIAQSFWKEIRLRSKEEIFALCEELLAGGVMEEAFVVATWVPHLSPRFEPGDLATFGRWIDRSLDNWAKVDAFCNHAVGDFLTKYPDRVIELRRWARSGNRWMRRAAAVSLVVPAKRGEFLDDLFAIADVLLTDGDDMVQKGYGWLLKEASRRHPQEVFAYVVRNRRSMPRTALRYAIELLPKEMKAEAMKKD
jgi:3-methyladenine DNA glycosylase AlkD